MNTTVQWARKIHKDHTLRQRLYRLPAIYRRVQHVLRKAFSTGLKYMVEWELPTQTHLVVALAFKHYVYHCSVVHFSIQTTTGMSNLKLRQSCVLNIDASLQIGAGWSSDTVHAASRVELAVLWRKVKLFYVFRKCERQLCFDNILTKVQHRLSKPLLCRVPNILFG